MTDVYIAFEKRRLTVPIDDLHPVKVVSDAVRKTRKYRQIAMSVREIGIVEPLIVYRQKGEKDKFLVLDGHLRLAALKELGATEAPCLFAKDDEAFTYNKRINRLASVQEHYMILKAVESGVPEDRLARALGVNVARIREKLNLLDGICPEAVEILKDRQFPARTIKVMRRMKPLRQVEMAELMLATNNFSLSYAKALLMATPEHQLKEPDKVKPVGGLSDENRHRMETELEGLRRDIRSVEESYGANVIRLVIANGYVTRILNSDRLTRYLARHHTYLLEQLQSVTESIAAETGMTLREDAPL